MTRRSLRRATAFVLSAVIAAALVTPAAAPAATAVSTSTDLRAAMVPMQDLTPEVVPGEVLVEFKKGVSAQAARRTVTSLGGLSLRSVGRTRIERVTLPATMSVDDGLARYASSPLVRRVEPNLYRFPAVIPNDTSFGQQWGLNNTGQSHGISGSNNVTSGTAGADMNLPEAWDITPGDPETVIAIVDSGVDPNHPDLAGNLWMNPDEIPGNGIDDDNNGLKDDVNGWDFAEGDNTLVEPNPNIFNADHGSHVAGIAAGVANNSTGIAGVCQQCKIMVLKVGSPIDSDGDGVDDSMGLDLASIIAAVDYAAAEGADILNASLGAPFFWSNFERAAFKRAGKAGVLSVVAAGNSNGDNDLLLAIDLDQPGDDEPDAISPNFPASYELDSILAVAASNDKDQNAYATGCFMFLGNRDWPCSFTNWGHESVDISAPGVDILSTVPGGGYEFFDGTSMASPMVAGVAGLVRSQNPTWGPKRIKDQILASADHPESLEELRAFPGAPAFGTFTRTGGRANAETALLIPAVQRGGFAGHANPLPTTDGNIAGAKGIKTKRSGGIGWPQDTNDVYKKKLRKGNKYKITLTGSANEEYSLWLWKPKTKGILQLGPGCFSPEPFQCKLFGLLDDPGTTESARFKIRKTGVYYFQVAAWLFSQGSYTLKIKKL